MTDETCQQKLRGDAWHPKTCGKPAKGYGPKRFGDGEIPLCGQHLAVVRRAAEREEERQIERAEQVTLKAQVAEQIKSIASALEVPASSFSMEYSGRTMRYTGGVTVDAALLLDALAGRAAVVGTKGEK